MTVAPEAPIANPNQKGSAIEGGLVSHEAIEAGVLENDKRGGGAQQYFTPVPVAELIARHFGDGATVFDPTAGDGSLLLKFHPDRSYGVELDPDQVKNSEGSYHALTGDIQHAYMMIRRAITFDAVVANPPFGNPTWSEPTLNDGKATNSALLTLMMLNRLMDEERGQIAFICGAGRWDKSISNKPDAKGMYALIEVEDMFPGTQTPALLAFGFHPLNSQLKEYRQANPEWVPVRKKMSVDMLDLLPSWLEEQREEAHNGYHNVYYGYSGQRQTSEAWPKIVNEYKRRRDDRLKEKEERTYDIQFFGGDRLDVQPNPYTQLVLRKMDKLQNISRLTGVAATYFIQNERDWNFIKVSVADGLLTIDPKVVTKVEEILQDTARVLCPMYPLKPVQRLGFLTDVDSLKCIKSDPDKGFDAGAYYDLSTQAQDVREKEVRPHRFKTGPRAGEWEDREYTKRYKVLQIKIGHLTLTDRQVDGQLIQYVVDHFEIPDKGDVKTRFPEEVKANYDLLKIIEQEMIENAKVFDEKNNIAEHRRFKGFRDFQIEDLSRLLVKEDGMLAWEQGLGKTIGGLAFLRAHEMKNNIKQQGLIICPKDLIPQWIREGERLLGRKIVVIKKHAQAKQVCKDMQRGKKGLFITYHEALSIVGTSKSKEGKVEIVEERTEEVQIPGTGTYGYWVIDGEGGKKKVTYNKYATMQRNSWNAERGEYEGAGVTWGHGDIPARWKIQTKQITSREICPRCKSDRVSGWNGLYCEAQVRDASDGSTRECGYSNYAVRVKPMASLLSVAFKRGAIIMDEATMIGGGADGSISKRLRIACGLRSKRRLGMTGTPIKNYIIQLFYPLWFCLGNNTPRFSYGFNNRNAFLTNFAVEEVAKVNNKVVSNGRNFLPQITNLSLFWRMMASATIRRRVDDTGEPIVGIHYFDINAPLGKNQHKRINMWAQHFPEHFKEKWPEKNYDPEWVLQAAPLLGLNQKNEYSELMPLADPEWDFAPTLETDPTAKYQNIKVSNYTPSTVRAMEVVMALVKNGEKVLVGSPLVLSSRFLAESLVEKGVKAIHILTSADQTQNPDARADTVFDFQTNDVDVLCTGLQAIRFGHNLDAASAVVMLGMPWDFETLDQFVKRVRRLTSQKPIRVFMVIPGVDTVTAKKWDLLKQKGDTASLALDGRIIQKDEVEIDRNQILAELVEKGVPLRGDEVDEAEVETAWHAIPHISEYEAPEGLIPVPPAPAPAVYEEINRDLLFEEGERLANLPKPFCPVNTPEQAKAWAEALHAYGQTRGKLIEGLRVSGLMDTYAGRAWHIQLGTSATPEVDTPVQVETPAPEAATVDLAMVMAKIAELEAKNAELEAKLEAQKPQQLSFDLGEKT